MTMLEEAMKMVTEPAEYFNFSDQAAHSVPRKDAEEMQRVALQQRFSDLRDQLPVLKSTAEEQGIDRIGKVEDAVNILFPHTVYKSYPISLLEKGRFDQLTKWLNRLTTHDLGTLDVSQCDGIDAWLDKIEDETEVNVVHSSGTSGTMSFLPRSRRDTRIKSQTWGMASRAFHGLENRPDPGNELWDSVFTGYRWGSSEAGRCAKWVVDNFAGTQDNMYTLYDMRMSSDVMFMAARVRKAQARGELDRLEVSPALRARHAEFEATMKNSQQAVDRMFDHLISLRGKERVYIGGLTAMVVDIAQKAIARGLTNLYGPNAVVQTGGGAKGVVLPDNWEEIICQFTGGKRVAQFYGMSEVTMTSPKCSHGHYHIPPWVVTYVLDPNTGKQLPREGVQTGRAAFFDLVPETYWGGFVTGDEITVEWGACPCGAETVHLHGKIQRLSEKQGGDDKITCAAADDAHAAAIDFLTQPKKQAAHG
jgi:hypothetical protein